MGPRKLPAPPALPDDPNRLVDVHSRFFADSIEAVKRISAQSGLPWQIELRLIVRRAVRVHLLKER